MMIKHQYLLFTILIMTALSLPLSSLSHAGMAQASNIIPVEPQAPITINWQDEDNKTHQITDSNGKPRLLHVWAAWCIPCRKEMPEMLQWQKQNPDITVIPLSLDKRIAQTRHFIKKNKLTMPALLLNQKNSDDLRIPIVPYTIFISGNGNISGYLYGIAPWESTSFSTQVRQHFNLD